MTFFGHHKRGPAAPWGWHPQHILEQRRHHPVWARKHRHLFQLKKTGLLLKLLASGARCFPLASRRDLHLLPAWKEKCSMTKHFRFLMEFCCNKRHVKTTKNRFWWIFCCVSVFLMILVNRTTRLLPFLPPFHGRILNQQTSVKRPGSWRWRKIIQWGSNSVWMIDYLFILHPKIVEGKKTAGHMQLLMLQLLNRNPLTLHRPARSWPIFSFSAVFLVSRAHLFLRKNNPKKKKPTGKTSTWTWKYCRAFMMAWSCLVPYSVACWRWFKPIFRILFSEGVHVANLFGK